jgi:hypothetical protein
MSTPLLKRLTQQLTDQGGIKDPEGLARSLLIKRGHMTEKGTLTSEGEKRQEMGADGRAIDRAVGRSSGHKAKDYTYSSKTNRATLKK